MKVSDIDIISQAKRDWALWYDHYKGLCQGHNLVVINGTLRIEDIRSDNPIRKAITEAIRTILEERQAQLMLHGVTDFEGKAISK